MINPHAFPSPGVIFTEPNTKQQRQQGAYEGMSLRDYFAAKAMVGQLAADKPQSQNMAYAKLAEVCYVLADAMLAERAK